MPKRARTPRLQVGEPPAADAVGPVVGARLQDAGELRPLRVVQTAGAAAGRLVPQAGRPLFVEAGDPVADRLAARAPGARRLGAKASAHDHGDGAKAAGRIFRICFRGPFAWLFRRVAGALDLDSGRHFAVSDLVLVLLIRHHVGDAFRPHAKYCRKNKVLRGCNQYILHGDAVHTIY